MQYQQPFIVLEARREAGAAVREWGHVRTFSPWRYMVDGAARELLESAGWPSPDADHLPTGNELIDQYVRPLAKHAAIRPHVRYNARVTSVGRKDFDKVRTKGRDQQPFEIRLDSGETIEARAVIDASGTWSRPNPAGLGRRHRRGRARAWRSRRLRHSRRRRRASARDTPASACSSSAAATRRSTSSSI